MKAFRPAPGIKILAAHVIFCGFSLLLLVLAGPHLALTQQTTDQQAKPQTLSIGGDPASGSNTATIRSHVRQVLFDVVVTDSHDRPVAGLLQSDFSVYEDGKIQRILSFEEHSGRPRATLNEAQTHSLTDPTPNTVLSTPTPVDSLPLNIILFDLLNTPPEAQAAGRKELSKLLEKRQAGMRLALFVLSDHLHLLRGFTDSDAELLAAMKSRAANIYFSPFLEPNSDNLTVEETLARRGLPPGVSLEASAHMDSLQQNFYVSHRIEMTIDAFTEIAHFVSGTPGRKNLVWLSAAFPVGISLGSDAASGKFGGTASVDPFAENYSPRLREATDRLTLSQVAVYPVDIRGLTPDSPLLAANAHQYQFPREFDGALMDAQLTRGGELQAMDKIAEDTSGHAFYNTNGLEHAMETALDDGSTYYTISYAPTNTKFDGSLRHIRVSFEAKGFQQLSYRRSYFADDPDTLREKAEKTPFGRLNASMQRGAPCAHEISFTANMASEGFPEQVNREQIRQLSYFTAFAGNKKWHGIKVQRFKIEYSVFGDQLPQAAAADGARHANLDFVAAAYDAEGRTMSGQLSSVQEKLTPNRLQDISAHGYRLRQHLDVPTTAAWLRICVRDALDDRAGCVESPLHQTQAPTAPMQPPHP